MKPIVTIASNAVIAKIQPADKDIKDLMTEALSYMVEGVDHMAAFSGGGWNGRSSFFERRTCTFPAGFVHLVHTKLMAAGYQVQLVRRPLPAPLGPENPIVDQFGNDDPRYDFQPKSLRQVEKHGRGIIQVATGGGKSKIAKLIMARLRRMTLFITTRGILMYQMKKAVERDCKFVCGIIGDGEFQPTKGVNVGMVQTFVAQLKEPSLIDERAGIVARHAAAQEKRLKAKAKDPTLAEIPDMTSEAIGKDAQAIFDQKTKIRNRLIKLLAMVEVVIGEEAHEAGGNSYYEILKYCRNAQYRIALTATPFMRDNAEDNMRLMAAFGPILIKVSEELLINRGILAKPYFKYVTSTAPLKLFRTTPWERAYKLGYMENPNMIADLVRDATMAKAHGLPVMCLVVRKSHGELIRKAYAAAGLRVEFIKGENDQEERERALERLARGEIDVLIGTTILDVGVDVPAVGLVQLAGGMKGEITLRQRCGRGLRAKKGVPNLAFIADYSTDRNSALAQHTRMRRAIIESTPGFVEGILPPGQDFPWHHFEKKAA